MKTLDKNKELNQKLTRLKKLQEREEIVNGLPHLYGQKFYPWGRRFFDSKEKYNFLCAANQIGKSSVQIRKCIDWATNIKKWPELWDSRPLTFWYLYPTKEVSTVEFEKKWITTFLPRGKFKDDPQFGWEAEYKNKFIWALHFKNGVSVYFKTYATDVSHLQTGTVWSIFGDEELPVDIFDELNMRIAATNGYFHLVFTATMGQEFFREIIEERGKKERLRDALKIQVSMYDCLFFEDGSPSHWSEERIEKVKNTCKSELEVQKRVYGRFIRDDLGRKYPSFSKDGNLIDPHPIPSDWNIYAGVDVGSGGVNHPAAITFVAVAPDYKKGRIFKFWRGDGVETTAADVLQRFQEMKGSLKLAGQYYDWASKDFGTIATRNGEPFTIADKSHDIGEQVINVLFKNQMLMGFDLPEIAPLYEELLCLNKNERKTHAKDDGSDSLRYAVTRIPWDWSAIQGQRVLVLKTKVDVQDKNDRRGFWDGEFSEEVVSEIEQELEEWNEMYHV